eukprot:TRINITY_DN2686_c0_g1_i2.p1 TRINITY_DN2686_c0_g1~~TRINITY_DN2686_c0_g1_i2.p1  ORF type:complete len:328 (+),score=92.93 TRINITY_DN2686_c0_g1_i2:128-1111(+)
MGLNEYLIKTTDYFHSVWIENKTLIQLVLVAFVILYIVNYFIGCSSNAKIAMEWYEGNKEYFSQSFAHLGLSNAVDGVSMEKESGNMYKLHASGRQNVKYALVTLSLKRRQDLLCLLFFDFVWGKKDTVIIEAPVKLQSSLPIVLSVVRRKDMKKSFEKLRDLKDLCHPIPFPLLRDTYAVIGEHEETAQYLLDEQVIAVLNKYDRILEKMHFTDRKIYSHDELVARYEFFLDRSRGKATELSLIFTKLFFHVIDKIPHYNLSAKERAKSEKDRRILLERNSKEEHAEQAKASKKEKDEKKLSPEEQKKREEKEERLRRKVKMVKVA